METKELELNYSELAFVMNIPVEESKAFFNSEFTDKEKVSTKDLLPVSKFIGAFGKTKSCDSRYDGLDKFEFMLEQCRKSFKKYINETAVVKKQKFGGGKAVFYKILSQEEIDWIKNNLFVKHDTVYGKPKHG